MDVVGGREGAALVPWLLAIRSEVAKISEGECVSSTETGDRYSVVYFQLTSQYHTPNMS